MTRRTRNLRTILTALALVLPGLAAHAAQPLNHDVSQIEDIPSSWDWAQVSSWLNSAKEVVELSDTSIVIEVNSTDGDAGFQVFLDGEGWKNAHVFDPDGRRILRVSATGGVRDIGGGTELFMESSEPEYDDLEEMQELIALLPEGEYYFLVRTTGNDWATGNAELTHDIPAGPEIVYPPAPENEDECSTGVMTDAAYIEWFPVETDIFGEDGIEIEAYQVIVESEDGDLEFSATCAAETTIMTLPAEVLAEGTEFTFEVLAIEESGNQTITEGCFETNGE